MHELQPSQQASDLPLQGLGPAVQGCGAARATTGWGRNALLAARPTGAEGQKAS